MKVLIFAFILISISAISTLEVKKIEGVEGYCYNVLFDSKFNTFVTCSDPESDNIQRIYKLDPDHNVVFGKELVYSDCGIFLTHKDELYVVCITLTGTFDFPADVNIIRADSSEMENITHIDSLLSIFVDNTGNLVYDGWAPGLYFLKYNTTEPVLVKNLEDFITIDDPYLTDNNGDTYVAGWSGELESHHFIVIPAGSKDGTPEAYEIEGLLDDPTKDFVEQLSVNSNNELLIGITDEIGVVTSVKKMSNYTVTTIYANETYDRYSVFPGEKRTIIIAYDFRYGTARVTSLSPDGEIVEIQNSRNETWSSEGKAATIDEDGNAFIEWGDVSEQRSHLEFLNHTDTTTVNVDLGDIKYIYYSLFDGNNNLWIKTDHEVYFVERGSLELQKVPDSSNCLDGWVNTKRKVSEIYMNSGNEFYVVSN